MGDKETINQLNEALQRLMNENRQLRRKIEATQVIIRRRAPDADGLSLVGSFKKILDDRDAAGARIDVYRQELKKAMQLILSGNVKEAARQINLFLFNNHR